MYPAATPEEGLPDGFETLLTPKRALLFSAQDTLDARDAALEEWRNALSK
jgi:thiamine transport system substrate-binding protein